jgi:hypothetical protein
VAGVAGDARLPDVRPPVRVEVARHLEHAARDDLGVLLVGRVVRGVVAVQAAGLRPRLGRDPLVHRQHRAGELARADVGEHLHVLPLPRGRRRRRRERPGHRVAIEPHPLQVRGRSRSPSRRRGSRSAPCSWGQPSHAVIPASAKAASSACAARCPPVMASSGPAGARCDARPGEKRWAEAGFRVRAWDSRGPAHRGCRAGEPTRRGRAAPSGPPAVRMPGVTVRGRRALDPARPTAWRCRSDHLPGGGGCSARRLGARASPPAAGSRRRPRRASPRGTAGSACLSTARAGPPPFCRRDLDRGG